MKTPRIIAEANGSTGTSYVPSAKSHKVIVIPESRTTGYYEFKLRSRHFLIFGAAP